MQQNNNAAARSYGFISFVRFVLAFEFVAAAAARRGCSNLFSACVRIERSA